MLSVLGSDGSHWEKPRQFRMITGCGFRSEKAIQGFISKFEVLPQVFLQGGRTVEYDCKVSGQSSICACTTVHVYRKIALPRGIEQRRPIVVLAGRPPRLLEAGKAKGASRTDWSVLTPQGRRSCNDAPSPSPHFSRTIAVHSVRSNANDWPNRPIGRLADGPIGRWAELRS